MRTVLRTLLVSLTAATALVTMTAGPTTAATSASVVSRPHCDIDGCFVPAAVEYPAPTDFDRALHLVNLVNKLNAILDEMPSAGVARPRLKA